VHYKRKNSFPTVSLIRSGQQTIIYLDNNLPYRG
jgi:hypothetical protein